MITPIIIAGNALFILISSIAATSAPVHAPVPGSGIATRSTRPNHSYFSTIPDCFFAFSSNLQTRWSSFSLLVLINANTFRTNNMIIGTGIKLPIIAAKSAVLTLRHWQRVGIAPPQLNDWHHGYKIVIMYFLYKFPKDQPSIIFSPQFLVFLIIQLISLVVNTTYVFPGIFCI